MLKRILTAAVGVPLVLAVVFFSSSLPVLIDIAMAIVCSVSVGEFACATKTLKQYHLSIPSLIFAAAYPMLMSYGYGFMLLYAYAAFMLSMTILFHKKITFKEFAYIFSMTVIITLFASTIVSMKNRDTAHVAFYFILSLGLPWLADIGAYFTGSFIGKHKLCPNISPKKTVEGAVGGTIVCMGSTCLLAWIFTTFFYGGKTDVNYISLLVLAFVGSLFSILGDLSFSLVKRTFNIKDYGYIFPVHGGMLDRFDSVIFVSPLILIYISYFPILMTR